MNPSLAPLPTLLLVSPSEEVGDGDLEAKVAVGHAVHVDRVDRAVQFQELEHALRGEDVVFVRGEGDVAPEVGFLNILPLFHTMFQPNKGITLDK